MPNQLTMRAVNAADIASIQCLHDRAFGPGRYARTAYRIREGLPLFSPLCRLAEADDILVAALRMAPVTVGGSARVQLLGPLAVEPALKGQGIGKALVAEALVSAKETGENLVLLVGDLPYYGRFGFNVATPGRFDLGGPVDPARLLCLELKPGALDCFQGAVCADYARASYR